MLGERSDQRGLWEQLLMAEVAEISMRASEVFTRDVDLGDLTRRERQMLLLISSGLNIVEIASELEISVHTVRRHVSRTLCKLGVASHSVCRDDPRLLRCAHGVGPGTARHGRSNDGVASLLRLGGPKLIAFE